MTDIWSWSNIVGKYLSKEQIELSKENEKEKKPLQPVFAILCFCWLGKNLKNVSICSMELVTWYYRCDLHRYYFSCLTRAGSDIKSNNDHRTRQESYIIFEWNGMDVSMHDCKMIYFRWSRLKRHHWSFPRRWGGVLKILWIGTFTIIDGQC